jgi:hypothetical protein
MEEKSIQDWCKKLKLRNYEIDINGNVNVGDYGVSMSEFLLKEIPIQFGIITGGFYCYNSYLTSLKGSPKKVGGDFSCYDNNLTSLDGGPLEVGGAYYCHNNKLITLEGCPIILGEDFVCHNNPVFDEYSKYDSYVHYIRTIKLKQLL